MTPSLTPDQDQVIKLIDAMMDPRNAGKASRGDYANAEAAMKFTIAAFHQLNALTAAAPPSPIPFPTEQAPTTHGQ